MDTEPLTIRIGDPENGGIVLHGTQYFLADRTSPSVLLTGGIHGDEATAIGAFWYLMETLAETPLAVNVAIFPCVNESAVRASTRLIPVENTDLNRAFPGRPDGSMAERIAHELMGLLKKDNGLIEVNALIDVHTAGWCMPFVLLDNMANSSMKARVARWAMASGLQVVDEMPAPKAALQGLDNSWSAVALSKGVPAVTVELPGFHTLEKEGAQIGANALLAMLKATSDLAFTEADVPPLPRRVEIYANSGGLLEAIRRPGDQICEGETIGRIRSVSGTVREEIIAPRQGLLLAVQPISAVSVGSFVATIAAL